jgi:putative two-component system response regulator
MMLHEPYSRGSHCNMLKETIRNSRILIIDDQPEIIVLLDNILRQDGYINLKGVTDSRDALTAISEFNPDLVALDLRMPNVDGFALLEQFRSQMPTGTLPPVLVFSADDSRMARQQALSMGAKDFVTKPLYAEEVQLRVNNLLETHWSHSALQKDNAVLEERVRERTKDLEAAQLEILQRLARAAEYRDDCTGHHTLRVGHLAGLLGRAIGLSAEHVMLLRRAAPLHDVGKIGIPDRILLKPGKLTPEEYIQVKTHTEIGCMILSGSRFPILQMAERIALYHHERWDGRGYHGLAGEAIPLEARIVSLVDAFDVIMHSRPYKKAEGAAAALEGICRERGKQFDPALVDAFAQLRPESADLWSSRSDMRVVDVIPAVSGLTAALGTEDPLPVLAKLPHLALRTAEIAFVQQASNLAIPVAWANPMERRKEPRLEINQQVTVTLLGEKDSLPFQAVAIDISGGGMRIITQRPVRYQAAVKVEVGDLLLLAEVIRIETCDRGNMLGLKVKGSLDSRSIHQARPIAIRPPSGHHAPRAHYGRA